MKIRAHRRTAPLLVFAFLLGSCTSPGPVGTTAPDGETPSQPPERAPTATSFQPPSPDAEPTFTPTAVPLAFTVNGEPVTLDEYNQALQRLHLGVPELSNEEAGVRVRDDFIDQILLARAAAENGFTLSESDFEDRLAGLVADAGGEDAFSAWLEANLYTPEGFAKDFRRAIAAAWMRDRIFETVPGSAEQVRARQIRVTTRVEADSVLQQLQTGTSFDIMIAVYDPDGLGDLGWFPRGFLFQPEIEAAAFAISPGDFSGVIETAVGFHIIEVTDYAEDRPLDPEARRALQTAALEAWLEQRRVEGEIVSFIE
ncbi:MAG TPA: peptidylprolyl isomerase [Anaerolineales bacterium]|nr:peptidylprolyl isomerase [Anaerolineales bacterium]